MTDTQGALEYKCPNCGGALHFGNESQKLTCPYCDSEFDVQSVIVYNERLMGEAPEEFQ